MNVIAVKKIIAELSTSRYYGLCLEIGTKCDRRYCVNLNKAAQMQVDEDAQVLQVSDSDSLGTCWIDTNEIASISI